MTNETKAPERIYMDGDIEVGDGYWTRCFEHPKPCSEPAIEYIRADLSDAKDARIAELEAALSDTADALDLANSLLRQKPVSYPIPLTNQFNARHAAAERARVALAELKGTD